MSRYKLQTNDSYVVFVGWDNPLQTFFYQSFLNYDSDEEKLTADLGNRFSEIPTFDYFADFLFDMGYDKINEDILTSLKLDFENKSEPTPLQKSVNDMFKS